MMANRKETSNTPGPFSGLKTLLDNVRKEQKIEAPKAVKEKTFGNDNESEGPTESDLLKRGLIVALNKELNKKNYILAYRVIRELSTIPAFNHKSRGSMLIISNSLKQLISHTSGDTTLTKDKKQEILSKMDEAISNFNFYAMPSEEREEHMLAKDYKHLRIDLPSDISKPKLLKNARVVMSVTNGFIPKSKGEHIADGVYVVGCDLIGVPATKSYQRDEERAVAYSLRYLNCEPIRIGLTRPDSDAVWFPILDFPITVDAAYFPEMLKRSPAIEKGLRVFVRAQAISRQRDQRLSFEEEHKDLYDELKACKDKIDALNHVSEDTRSGFINRCGLKPNIKVDRLKAYCLRSMTEELAGEREALKRLEIRKAWKEAEEILIELRNLYVDTRLRIKVRRNKIKRINAELVELKRAVCIPAYKTFSKLNVRH